MFLEILTRHYVRRPNLVRRNQDSLARQTCDDWQQTLLIDDVGRGVAWANRNLAAYASRLEGEYIWILDDDDVCACNTLVEDAMRIVAERDPDVIIVRGEWMDRGLVPDDEHWGRPPMFGKVGMSNFVIRRHVWQEHAKALAVDVGADYHFIRDVFAGDHNIYWHDVVMFCVPTPKFGAPE